VIHSIGTNGWSGPTRNTGMLEFNALPLLPVGGVADTASFRPARRHIASLSLMIGKWHPRPGDNTGIADPPVSQKRTTFAKS
jgi:hypothetical protein